MITKLTKSEMQVMQLLWKADKAMSCSQIVEASDDKTWKDSYVHSLVKSLMKKKMVRIADFELISRSYARMFEPIVTYNEYVLLSSFEDEELADAEKMAGFFKVYLKNTSSPELIAAIEKILRAEKKALNQ